MELHIGSGSFVFEICVSVGDAMTPRPQPDRILTHEHALRMYKRFQERGVYYEASYFWGEFEKCVSHTPNIERDKVLEIFEKLPIQGGCDWNLPKISLFVWRSDIDKVLEELRTAPEEEQIHLFCPKCGLEQTLSKELWLLSCYKRLCQSGCGEMQKQEEQG